VRVLVTFTEHRGRALSTRDSAYVPYPFHPEPEALDYLEPEDLEELVAAREVGPVQPGFEPF
jgi:hypothetical protein